MNMRPRMKPRRILLATTFLVFFVSASIYFNPAGQARHMPELTSPAAIPIAKQDHVFSGHEACAECHEAETAAWMASAHFDTAPAKLTVAQADDWGAELGIADVKTDMRCVQCHGQQADVEPIIATVGVSCESCHGPAGGMGGWLDLHSELGTDSVLMEDLMADIKDGLEADGDRDARRVACEAVGMLTSREEKAVILNCLECHAVFDAELAEVGHPSSEKFEFARWSQGEVRHNLLVDPAVNDVVSSRWLFDDGDRAASSRVRRMYIIGQLVDLEYSFRQRASLTEGNKLFKRVNERIDNAADELEKIKKQLTSDGDARFDALFADGGMLDDVDKRLKELEPTDKDVYGAHADEIAELAEEFIDAYPDGEGLSEELDRRIKRPVGESFEPESE